MTDKNFYIVSLQHKHSVLKLKLKLASMAELSTGNILIMNGCVKASSWIGTVTHWCIDIGNS